MIDDADKTAMHETMTEIENENPNRRNQLKADISELEAEIKKAQDIVDQSNQEAYTYHPITPEQANERLKAIVFLKKNLASKKAELVDLI